MAKEATKKSEAEGSAAEAPKPIEQNLDELRAQIRAEEREKAMADALQQLGIDPDKVSKESDEAKAHREFINEPMFFELGPVIVNLNGVEYTGSGQAPRHIVECLMETASKRQNRILREALGNSYRVEQVSGGAISSRLVGPAPAAATT